MRASNVHWLTLPYCTDDVRNEPVRGPVSSANHVAGARTCDGDTMPVKGGGVEERIAIRRSDKLRTRFAAAVRVVPTHRFVFAVAPFPFAIFIALVGSHDNDRTYLRGLPDRLE